jgi:hypothetical protein
VPVVGTVVGAGGELVTVVTVRHFGCAGRLKQKSGLGPATTLAANTPVTKKGTRATKRRTPLRYSSQTMYTWHAWPVPFSTTTPTPFAVPVGIRIP